MADSRDGIEILECVYYSAPIPRNAAILTVLSFVFDKIHFPGVYLPMGNYDEEALAAEIVRLEQIPPTHDTAFLIGMLKFLPLRFPLDGILEFPSSSEDIFDRKNDDDGTQQRVRDIYDAMYPPRDGWEPIFDSAHTKALPNSDECITYRGSFHYPAAAIGYASQHNLSLINDEPTLPVLGDQNHKLNATALSTLLAMECIQLILPQMPLFTPRDIVEFQIENKTLLHTFRSSMLRYAKDINELLDEGAPEDVTEKTKFFLETEIKPTLHDLGQVLNQPLRSWPKRATDGIRIASQVTMSYLTGGAVGGEAAASSMLDFLQSELAARGDRDDAMKRSGLYYLLKLKEARR